MGQFYPLYDERMEHEACGIGAVVNLNGIDDHRAVDSALTIVERLAHRAGCDAEGATGDGVGIMTEIPHVLFSRWAAARGLSLGEGRDYGAAMLFLSADAAAEKAAFEAACRTEGLRFIAWRDVPVCPELLGRGARESMPAIVQGFVARPEETGRGAAFDRRLYVLRRRFEKAAPQAYVCSLSSRTIVYKGMMLVTQLRAFYPDLQQEDYTSAAALVHSRFSTNTNPSWSKAHPHRMLLHNGEINTIRGNADRMLAREETMSSRLLGERVETIYPIVNPTGSDSAMLDNALEFLSMNGVPLPLASMILVPEAWQGRAEKTPWQAMYHYYSTLMEPWDGPAALLCFDGDSVLAMLDRNGLRPLRRMETDDGRLILSSEAGVLHEEEARVLRRGRLRGGELICADLRQGRLYESDALKSHFAALLPYEKWLEKGVLHLSDLPLSDAAAPAYDPRAAKALGYTYEDYFSVLIPMAEKGTEPIGSMGADIPLAALSKAHPPLFSYFKQRFAQVTNPPIDALREKSRTDTSVYLGDHGNLLAPDERACRVLELAAPVLSESDMLRVKALDKDGLRAATVSLLVDTAAHESMESALKRLFDKCDRLHAQGVTVIVLSDRGLDERHAALPTLLAVSALEQHLVRTKKRTAVSVAVECGDVRDAHQAAMLVAFGARAIAPYMAEAAVRDLAARGLIHKSPDEAARSYLNALTAGILHISSKMGVSTLGAYQSAQLFEAVGLNADFVERYFTNTPHHLGGVGLEHIERETLWHHGRAYNSTDAAPDSVGFHKLRTGKDTEEHLYSPEVIHTLQQALWNDDPALFEKYASLVENDGPRTIRSLLDFNFDACTPVPLEEVEPASSIVHRFKTGAMSYGSLSREAHECLATAMNRLGGKSNTGEGGELAERFGTARNSAIKQVASGRFGVTTPYLRSAKEIQIKMAQGAKPGEGGHLPGAKVSEEVAKTRCSTPGLSLISPPPHHDIYSIEDLAQLIYDLKCVNPAADLSVKLVSSCGVGTVASGVAKAGAQVILISGGEGGTGAAPLTSIHGAGLPWELGLAEAHQTLCKNGLRSMVKLETDGKLMTGRDVAIALLLGAEEFAFATAPLIALGCRMMRVCNLDTCPFGVATQNPELRKRFKGKPEYVERFMLFVAEELRGVMARLGARTVDELVGRGDLLRVKTNCPIDLSEITNFSDNHRFNRAETYDFHLSERADASYKPHVRLSTVDRSFGAMLPETDVPRAVECTGCGGQSFGAFLTKNYTLTLTGVANDYVGKGLSGGTLVIRPEGYSESRRGDALIGNVALFGATGGSAYIAGAAGERFCVRNSGARAVAEGVGDHGCEYMTGGRAAILGGVGENFAAGMSGGVAYVLDDGALESHVNPGMVDILPVEGDFERELRDMISEHARLTGSPLAQEILDQWDEHRARFRMIIPREYRRLLEGM